MWKSCRDAYMLSVNGLCEDCLARGIAEPAEIVHHVIHLDDALANDPQTALSFDNLRAVCRECHGREHRREAFGGRYRLDKFGNLIDNPP